MFLVWSVNSRPARSCVSLRIVARVVAFVLFFFYQPFSMWPQFKHDNVAFAAVLLYVHMYLLMLFPSESLITISSWDVANANFLCSHLLRDWK